MSQIYCATAPGSAMVMGEHAVLRGHPAVVCALNSRIKVTLTPQAGQTIHLNAGPLGDFETAIDNLCITPPFTFALACLCHFRAAFKSGCQIRIESQMRSDQGFGSSAAVSVALVACLSQWLGQDTSPRTLFHNTLQVIRAVQKLGSGADVAASVFGGILRYPADGQDVQRLGDALPFRLIYCGYKTPTATVVQQVNRDAARDPARYTQLFSDLGQCVESAIPAITAQDWQQLGQLFDQHHALQCSLGVSTDMIEGLVKQLRCRSEVYGVKLSGSGLGDCIMALGDVNAWPHDSTPLLPKLAISSQGVLLG